MSRLILFLLLLIAVLIAVMFMWHALRVVVGAEDHRAEPERRNQGDTLPDTFKTIAYVLLIVLMFGVVTGWLAGL